MTIPFHENTSSWRLAEAASLVAFPAAGVHVISYGFDQMHANLDSRLSQHPHVKPFRPVGRVASALVLAGVVGTSVELIARGEGRRMFEAPLQTLVPVVAGISAVVAEMNIARQSLSGIGAACVLAVSYGFLVEEPFKSFIKRIFS